MTAFILSPFGVVLLLGACFFLFFAFSLLSWTRRTTIELAATAARVRAGREDGAGRAQVIAGFFLFPPYTLRALVEVVWALVVGIFGVVGALLGLLGSLLAPEGERAVRARAALANLGRASTGWLLRLLVLAGLAPRRRLVATPASRPPSAPSLPPAVEEPVLPFLDRYVVLDRLPGAGSTAELFVVQARDDGAKPPSRLLLKCFDLTRGAWLDSLVRESEGMKLAKRVGLISDYMFGDDYFYYVMPYYDGETLHDATMRAFRNLHSSQGLPLAELRRALAWVRDLLVLEVQRYHDAGLIHKDIKPDNVILVGSRPRLIDVGLVTQLGSAMTLTTHGTEYFRDPELVRLAIAGTKVKDVPAERFDIYSTGALLYFVTQGTFPATGPFSRPVRPVPYPVSAIAIKAMSDFDKRYTSARAMAADLDALLAADSLEGVAVAALPSFAAPPAA